MVHSIGSIIALSHNAGLKGVVDLGVGLVPRSGFCSVGRFVTFVTVLQLAKAASSFALCHCLIIGSILKGIPFRFLQLAEAAILEVIRFCLTPF